MTDSEDVQPRLDLLLYAHDGRGLGHVARSVAVALGVRRLYPELRVLLATGARGVAELAGSAPLDWVKLPSYATRVVAGRSRGVAGPSGFGDADLGTLRASLLAQLVGTLRPRLVLVDHSPQGKHRELLPALHASGGTRWLLGLRAVVGDVPQLFSEIALRSFTERYSGVLWYGDSAALGAAEPEAIRAALGAAPSEVGYVSRLAELEAGGWLAPGAGAPLAGTVAVPWAGEGTVAFAGALGAALARLGAGTWRVFFDDPGCAAATALRRAAGGAAEVEIHAAGTGYLDSLRASQVAVVYGGYNSLTDVLHARVPALVVLRGMADAEQERHVQAIAARSHGALEMLDEVDTDGDRLTRTLERLLATAAPTTSPVCLDGAVRAAAAIARSLDVH